MAAYGDKPWVHNSKQLHSCIEEVTEPIRNNLAPNYCNLRDTTNVRQDMTQLVVMCDVKITVDDSEKDSTKYVFTKHFAPPKKCVFLGILNKEEILGISDGPFREIDFHCVSVNRDWSRLAFVVGLVLSKATAIEEVQYFVMVMDVMNWKLIYNYSVSSWITPSAAFDPIRPECLLTFHIPAEGGKATLQYHDSSSGHVLLRHQTALIDADGDAMSKMIFSRDMNYLIVLIGEKLWYSSDTLCRIFVINSSDVITIGANTNITTEITVTRLGSCVVNGCHDVCAANLLPVLSSCGSNVSLNGHGRQITEFQLPSKLNLKHICRSKLLRNHPLDDAIDTLPLPESLKQYLRFAS